MLGLSTLVLASRYGRPRRRWSRLAISTVNLRAYLVYLLLAWRHIDPLLGHLPISVSIFALILQQNVRVEHVVRYVID